MWTCHVVIGTYRSWDVGDERGFRSRNNSGFHPCLK